jgi:hypothetical protein
LKYGTGSYDALFTTLYSFYPDHFTIGENMKLTRQLFPLLFQLVLIFCDLTIDAPVQLSAEEEQEQENRKTRFRTFAAKQQELIAELSEVLALSKEDLTSDKLSGMYEK